MLENSRWLQLSKRQRLTFPPGMKIHNLKVGGSIPPPLPMFLTTYGKLRACRFSLVTLLSREILVA